MIPSRTRLVAAAAMLLLTGRMIAQSGIPAATNTFSGESAAASAGYNVVGFADVGVTRTDASGDVFNPQRAYSRRRSGRRLV